jgi:hypothetical protein
MRAEFDEAIAAGRPLHFASGCLAAAWREMPKLAEGRLVLTHYALALCMLIPMAVLQFAMALGFSSLLGGHDTFSGILLAGATQNPILALCQFSAAPCLLALWLVLGIGHLGIAWLVVERDWAGVANVAAIIGSALATLFIFTAALVLDPTFLFLQAAAMAVEMHVLIAVARPHARLAL